MSPITPSSSRFQGASRLPNFPLIKVSQPGKLGEAGEQLETIFYTYNPSYFLLPLPPYTREKIPYKYPSRGSMGSGN